MRSGSDNRNSVAGFQERGTSAQDGLGSVPGPILREDLVPSTLPGEKTGETVGFHPLKFSVSPDRFSKVVSSGVDC